MRRASASRGSAPGSRPSRSAEASASIALSLVYRMPIMCAWSTPGAALLVTSIADYPYSAVIGAYVAAALVTLLVGVTGVFRRLMALVPEPVVLGVLAGVLFRFGVGLVTAVPDAPEIVVPMIAAYLLSSRLGYRAPAIVAIAIGVAHRRRARPHRAGDPARRAQRPGVHAPDVRARRDRRHRPAALRADDGRAERDRLRRPARERLLRTRRSTA